MIEAEELREVVRPWPDDPVRFAENCFAGSPLRAWQRKALAALAEDRRLAVAAARGTGKTVLSALAAAWWTCTRPDGLVIVIAPTWSQSEIWWSTFGALWNASRARLLFPESELLRAELRDGGRARIVTVSGESGEAIEGYHAPAVLVIHDEAKAIEDSTFRLSRGYLAGADETAELAVSTPGRPSGWFFRRWQSEEWGKLRVPASEVPELAAMLPELAADFEPDDPFFRAQYGAEFADVGEAESALFSVAQVDAATMRDIAPDGSRRARVLGVDPAGFGRDEFAVALRDGPIVQRIATWQRSDAMESAGRILRLAGENEAEAIVVDVTGLGFAIHSRLAEVAREDSRHGGRLRVFPFTAGGAPRDKARFQNAKSEAWYAMRQRFERGEVSIPDDRKLAAQLLSLTVTANSAGRLRVVDPPRSPDRADALLLSFAFEAISRPLFATANLPFLR